MKETSDAELRSAVRIAMQQDPSRPAPAAAASLIAQNPDLLRRWLLDRITEIFHKARPRENPFQMFLPGFRQALDQRVHLEKSFVTLRAATIKTLRDSLKIVKRSRAETPDPREKRLTQLIAEMAPYSKTERGVTVERYCQLRAAGVEPKRKTPSKVRSPKV